MIFTFEHAFKAGDRDFADLDRAIADCVESQSVPAPVAVQVMIAFDELISNILNNRTVPSDRVNNGKSEDDPKLIVQVEVLDASLAAEVADNGPAFDPLSLPDPDTSLPAEDREFGGLGVHLVRKLMDEVVYSRTNGWNRLRFSKTFELE